MNARPTFPMDLTQQASLGYLEISRRVALLVNEFMPHSQAARLTLRAAALQAAAHVPPAEIAHAMRDIADELEAMG